MELNLLVEAPELVDRLCIDVGGKRWCLTNVPMDGDADDLPDYVCISYRWGSGRVPNPLDPSMDMAAQTIPALVATLRDTSANAYWIDALCVPARFPQRRATLESMGFIYGHASQVVVVLSAESFGAIEQMTRSDKLDEDILAILDQDAWVKSVWTYQEVVNNRQLYFASAGGSGSIVEGSDFLDRIGYSLSLYKKKYNLDEDLDVRERFPGLDALEDVIADWITSSYCRRSVLQILSNMDRRFSDESFNYFYAIMGVVTTRRSSSMGQPSVASLAEAFMRLCEEKNDYSFIYSSTERDGRIGVEWRPVATIFHSILPWHSWGEGQRAHRDPEGLWLEDMVTLYESHVLDWHAQQQLRKRLCVPEDKDLTEIALAERMYNTLLRRGFTGSSRALITRVGLFFPQTAISRHVKFVILISAALSWTFGAPGILQMRNKGRFSYMPGVFAGVIKKDEATSVLIGVDSPYGGNVRGDGGT